MSIIFIAVIAVVLVAGFAFYTKTMAPQAAAPEPKETGAPFLLDTKPYFFSVAENKFYSALVSVAQAMDLLVFPKVGLNDIFKDTKEAAKGQYNRYAQMHVDYLLVTRKDYKPVAGIELDGSSHQGEKQKGRDQKKEAAFKAAKLPLLRFYNEEKLNEMDLRTKLEDLLGAQPTGVGS